MKTKKITALALLTAIALIIFIVEAQLPPLTPIPGIKLGLANVVTLVTLVWFGRREAFLVLIMRIILGSIFAGHMTSFLYSLAGGLFCFLVMSVSYHFLFNDKLWVISVLGAIVHNTAQLAVAVVLTSTWQVTAYFPVLFISAVITGAFTGLAATFAVRHNFFGKRSD